MRFLSGSKTLYFVTLVFVTASAGLFWLDSFRVSHAEMAILVKDRSNQGTDAPAALSEIASTLRFAESVAEEPGLGDILPADKPADERKKVWQSRFSAEPEEGGLVSVRLDAASQEEARLLASGFLKAFLATASRYYDVEREIDVRVVEGPLLSTGIRLPLLYAFVSLLSGFVVTSLFFAALFGVGRITLPFKKRAEEANLPIGEAVPWSDPSKFVPIRPRALAYDEPADDGDLIPEAVGSAAFGAPENLPVLDEVPVYEFEPMPSEEASDEPAEAEEQKQPAAPAGEPTAEEYKRRLNELLRGKNL